MFGFGKFAGHTKLTVILGYENYFYSTLKDTYREKLPSNKTPVYTKNMDMDIWVVAISNQVFMRGSYTKQKFYKNKGRYWQNTVLCDCSILYLYSICLNIGF